MTAEEYLGQIRRLDMMISNSNRDVQRFKDLATSITVAMGKEKVQGGNGTSDIVGNNVAAYVSIEEKGEIAVWYEERQSIIMQISSMPDSRDYQILYEKFVDGRPLASVADHMDITTRHIQRLYRQAIQNFDREYHSSYKNFF